MCARDGAERGSTPRAGAAGPRAVSVKVVVRVAARRIDWGKTKSQDGPLESAVLAW